jgi:hypothetical protein
MRNKSYGGRLPRNQPFTEKPANLSIFTVGVSTLERFQIGSTRTCQVRFCLLAKLRQVDIAG